MEGEKQGNIDMEDGKLQLLMGSLVPIDTLKVPVTAPLPTTPTKVTSHGIDLQEGDDGKGQYQENEDLGKGHASSKLLELAGSNHLLQIRGRNVLQGTTPPRSPVDERLVGSPSVDNTVDQILANTVNVSLWSSTPRSRPLQTPSPTLDQTFSPTPRDNSSQDEDMSCLTPVEIMSDSDRRLEEANKEISKLTRQAFQMSAEKELIEGDLDFWKARAYELERRLRNAEEDAVQKEEQVDTLERQLEIARQPLLEGGGGGAVRSPSTHPCSRMTGSPPASDSHRSQSINSHRSSEHHARSNTARSSNIAQQQFVGVDLRMKPAFMQLLSALRALILKMIWRAQDSTENLQQQLVRVMKKVMQDKGVQKAWSYVSKEVLPTVGWTGLSVFIVIVCTGFMQMWRTGASTLITWIS
eukprot:TRINITY_DN14349_c0_g1_i1.p1 TRINITY_DN14349_c0_g1~~TRINITY_DN14349_c0_g1_i1.p1  ORF type:complete len:412 (-),score=62.46 TRINITY_DN14349_c0_g1_i1:627-1862(-)